MFTYLCLAYPTPLTLEHVCIVQVCTTMLILSFVTVLRSFKNTNNEQFCNVLDLIDTLALSSEYHTLEKLALPNVEIQESRGEGWGNNFAQVSHY